MRTRTEADVIAPISENEPDAYRGQKRQQEERGAEVGDSDNADRTRSILADSFSEDARHEDKEQGGGQRAAHDEQEERH
jgi:hypothetical protein